MKIDVRTGEGAPWDWKVWHCRQLRQISTGIAFDSESALWVEAVGADPSGFLITQVHQAARIHISPPLRLVLIDPIAEPANYAASCIPATHRSPLHEAYCRLIEQKARQPRRPGDWWDPTPKHPDQG
jgi:hypothetical protein